MTPATTVTVDLGPMWPAEELGEHIERALECGVLLGGRALENVVLDEAVAKDVVQSRLEFVGRGEQRLSVLGEHGIGLAWSTGVPKTVASVLKDLSRRVRSGR